MTFLLCSVLELEDLFGDSEGDSKLQIFHALEISVFLFGYLI